MRITIAQRLRPFSHTPGTYCLLPGSFLRLQVFPTRLVVVDLSTSNSNVLHTFDFGLKGPVKDFTVQQDLEKGVVRVWGHYQEGFVRYRVTAGSETKDFQIAIERAPESGISITGIDAPLKAKESYSPKRGFTPFVPHDKERLSFGCHKAQDWDRIHRSPNMDEILPFIFRLGRMLPLTGSGENGGVISLLEKVEKSDRSEAATLMRQFYLAGFEGILSPKLEDNLLLGLDLPSLSKKSGGSPLEVLTRGSQVIRDCLIQESAQQLSLLPKLPPELHAGRLTALDIQDIGSVDLEWSKKTLKKVMIHATNTATLQLAIPKTLKSFRLRKSKKEKGIRVDAGQSIEISSGITYYLDNFKK